MRNKLQGVKTLLLSFLIILLLSSVQPIGLIEPWNATDRGFSPAGDIVNDPININGNDDFANQASIEEWTGTGLMGNPYLIENLLIDASTAHGIQIANTQVHFIIYNCTIFGGDTSGYHGIVLTAVSNGIIRENELDDDEHGISLLNSASNTIEDNTVNECGNGIFLENSDVNDVFRNKVSNSSATGIRLRWCDNSVVENNTCTNSQWGMHIERGEYDTIHNNTISGSTYTDLQVGDLTRWHIVTNNTCMTNGETNIWFIDPANATVLYNRMSGLGLAYESDFSWWARLLAFTDNTVNGTPVLFVQDQNGGAVSGVYAQVILVNCANVLVQDMVLTGVARGVTVLACNDTIVKNVSTIGCYYGIYIVGGYRVTVTDCSVSDSTNTGLVIGWGFAPYGVEYPEYHLITNSTFNDSEYKGMLIGGYGGTTIFNNTVYDNGLDHSNQHQMHVFASNDITIANNTIWGTRSGSSSIFCYAPNSVIANNTCIASNDGYAITLTDTEGIVVIDNYCVGNVRGIAIDDTSNSYVANNFLNDNDVAIQCYGLSFNNTIAFNNCSDGGWAGIILGGESNNLILKNICKNTTGSGIYLTNLESINIIANNTCSENADEGINVYRSEWSIIANNTCVDNPVGILVDPDSHNNSIYWNVLSGNTDNAVDNGGDNYITNNYWSDYAGADGNADGIGDTPHPITGSAVNEDPYPWMSPSFSPIPSAWMVPPFDQYLEYGQDLSYDLDTMGPSPIWIWISDTELFSIDGSLEINNIAPLTVGVYEIRVMCRNMYGHHLFGEFEVIVEDTTSPTWTQTPTDQSVEYTESFFYDLNATDLSGTPTYWVNDTSRFSVNTQGHVTQDTDLPVGVYGLEFRAIDIYDNFVSTSITITVTDSIAPEIDHPSDVEFYETEGETVYWYPTDDNPVSYQLLKDGTYYGSGWWTEVMSYISWYFDGPSLGVGVYNFTIIVTDAGGNSVSDSVILTVVQEIMTETTTTTTTTTTTSGGGIPEIPMTIILLGGLGIVVVVIVVVIKRR